MARNALFDPDASLTASVEQAVAPGALPKDLHESLRKGEGRRIYGWLLQRLMARKVANAWQEADDLFQQFCAVVYAQLHRRGPNVAASRFWFWQVARNLLYKHVQRELVEKRDLERPIDRDIRESESRFDSSLALAWMDPWAEDGLGRLVLRCIAKLPRRQQEFLHLYLVQRLSGAELDAALGLQPKARAALKAKVMRNLRDELRAELGKVPEPLGRLRADRSSRRRKTGRQRFRSRQERAEEIGQRLESLRPQTESREELAHWAIQVAFSDIHDSLDQPMTNSEGEFATSPSRDSLERIERTAQVASIAEIATTLQQHLGQRVTAYLSGVKDPKMVGRWAGGKVKPREVTELRLRAAYPVAELLVDVYGPDTARAWFFGTNTRLGGEAPAHLLRHGEPPFRSLLPAARAFVQGDVG